MSPESVPAPLLRGADGLEIRVADTDEERLECADIRLEVFVAEQGVPFVLEIDARDADPRVVHLLAMRNGEALGTLRIIPDGAGRWRLGRLAVRALARGLGVGALLVWGVHEYVARRTPCEETARIVLDAQVRARGFYERQGYAPTTGGVFLDAGIEHVEMARSLDGRMREA